MFAIAGIVLLLTDAQLRPDELVVNGLPVPLTALAVALGLFGLAIDLKLRKSQLIAAPHLGWAVALAGWLALTAPGDVSIAFALFLLIAQGVQRFRALATVAATLVLLALGLALRALRYGVDDATELTIALAAVVPLAVALFVRNRSLTRGFLLLLTVGLGGLCVIETRSRTGGIGASLAWPDAVTLLLAAAMIYVSFKIIVVVRRHYADDAIAAVARTWARALAVSLAIVSLGLLFLPAGHHVLFWVYSGLAGALYQATRAHDPQFSLRRVLMTMPRRDP